MKRTIANFLFPFIVGLAACATVLFIPACTGCDDSGGPGGNGANCSDNDGDGYGPGCNKGEDCNDFNPEIIGACDCSQENYAGCECTNEGEEESCFSGRDEELGVGICMPGTRRCEGGSWTPCIGELPPLAEGCNDQDDDCDGEVDEDQPVGPCGTCDMFCQVDGIGRGTDSPQWMDRGEISDGVEVNDEGGLQLNSEGGDFNFLYIANADEGTVSKIDTRNGNEVARYVSSLNGGGRPPALETCNFSNRGNCPSRTAVDLQGNVWVANRAFGGQGSVTKIANRDCVDRNGNGTIETSEDLNGDGQIGLNGAEFLGQNDECVLFTVNLGGQSVPRAVAIDPFAPRRGIGSVWVGAHAERRYYQVDAEDGTIIRTVDVPHQPYGCVIDRFGVLWSSDLAEANSGSGHRGLVKIISATGEVDGPVIPVPDNDNCGNAYGITIDGSDNVWVAGFNCSNANRYNPENGNWREVTFRNGTQSRGIAVDRDGWVYVGTSNNGGIVRFRSNPVGDDIEYFNAEPEADGTIGVGVDFFGKIWGVNRNTSNTTRLDPATGQMDVFPTGDGPYTYSDFTGFTLRNFTAPQGTYTTDIEGCPSTEGTIWNSIVWDGDTPPGTDIEAYIRVADTVEGLASAREYGPFDESPVDLEAEGIDNGRFARVTFRMSTSVPGTTPILWSFDVQFSCPPL